MTSSFRARIASGEPLGCLWLSLGSPAIAEIAAGAEPDAVVFDQQHGLWDRLSLEAAIGLVRPHTAPLVRVARNGALEIGTDAVVDGLERGLEEVHPGEMAAGVAFGRVMDAKAVEREFGSYHDPAETWS